MTNLNATPRTGPGRTGGFFTSPYLLLTLAPLFWAGNMIAGMLAVGEVDAMALSVWRWLGALLLVLPFALPSLRADWPEIRRGMIWLFLFGALGFATFNTLIYTASHLTSGINIGMEQALIPVLVMLANFLIFRVRARALQVVGVAVTIIGVAVVATHGEPARLLALDINEGDGLIILACVLYASYSLCLRFRPAIGWMSFIFATSLAALATATLTLVVFGGGIAGATEKLLAVSPFGWAIVAYVAIFPSVLAQLYYARGVEMVGPNRASIFINLLPVFGALLAVLVLGEAFQLFHAVAALLIIAGIALAEFSVRAHKKGGSQGAAP